MSHFRLAVWTHRSQLLYLYCKSVSLLHWIATWYIHVSFKNVIQSDKQYSNDWKHLNIRAATAALQACLCFKNQSPKLQSITPILNDIPISSNKLLTNSLPPIAFTLFYFPRFVFFPDIFIVRSKNELLNCIFSSSEFHGFVLLLVKFLNQV